MRNEVTFHADPLKAILLLFGCIVFVILGLAFSERLIAAFFGLGIPAAIVMLSDKHYYLKLTPNGVEIRALLSKQFIRWRDIKHFEIDSIRGNKVIAISYKESHADGKLGRRLTSLVTGMEGWIPNNYERTAEEVVQTLCEWHDRFSGPAPGKSLNPDSPTSGAPVG